MPDRVYLGRVLNEDADFMILEVAKHDLATFHLNKGDRFYTLTFPAGPPWEQPEG